MESLYLHPSAVGRGLGRALHRHAIDDLFARGFDPLILWAFAANQRARCFYECAGWVLDVSGQTGFWMASPAPSYAIAWTDRRHDVRGLAIAAGLQRARAASAVRAQQRSPSESPAEASRHGLSRSQATASTKRIQRRQWPLWVGSASSVDRTAVAQPASDASQRGKISSDRFGECASLRRLAPMAAVLGNRSLADQSLRCLEDRKWPVR